MSKYGRDRNPGSDTLLTFKVGDSDFCTSAIAVESIEKVQTVTSLPFTPHTVEGVFLYRDYVATVVCTARKLGLKIPQSDNESPYFIVTNIENQYVAFRVDEVRDLISTSEVTWNSLDTFVEGPFTQFALWEEQVYLYIDLHLLYTLPEWQTIEYLKPSLAQGKPGSLPEQLPSNDQLEGGDRDDAVVVHPVNTEPAEVVTSEENLCSQFGSEVKPETKEEITQNISRKRVENENRVKREESVYPPAADEKSRTGSSINSTADPKHMEKFHQTPVPAWRTARKTSRITRNTLHDHARKAPARFRLLIIAGAILSGLTLSAYFISATYSSSDGFTFRSQSTNPADIDIPDKRTARKYTETGMGLHVDRYQSVGEDARSNRMTEEETTGSKSGAQFAESQADLGNREHSTGTDNIRSAQSSPDEIYRYDGEKFSLSVERPQIAGQISDDGHRTQVNPEKERGTNATGNVAENSPTRNPTTLYDETVHIVESGDTLRDIAYFYLGNPFRYPELAELSHIRDPDLIYPGDQVRIIRTDVIHGPE